MKYLENDKFSKIFVRNEYFRFMTCCNTNRNSTGSIST